MTDRVVSLAALLRQTAKPLSGDVVIRALLEVSEEVWDAGLDHEFCGAAPGDADFERRAEAFDAEWMTRLLAKLTGARGVQYAPREDEDEGEVPSKGGGPSSAGEHLPRVSQTRSLSGALDETQNSATADSAPSSGAAPPRELLGGTDISRGVVAYLDWKKSGDSSPSNLVHAILAAVGAAQGIGEGPPQEPSEAAIEAAREASGAVRDQPDNLLGRRMVIAVLRAAYAVDRGRAVEGGSPDTELLDQELVSQECDGCGATITMAHLTAFRLEITGPTLGRREFLACSPKCGDKWFNSEAPARVRGLPCSTRGDPEMMRHPKDTWIRRLIAALLVDVRTRRPVCPVCWTPFSDWFVWGCWSYCYLCHDATGYVILEPQAGRCADTVTM